MPPRTPRNFRPGYGNISAASVGAMQRGLLALEQQGGDKFLGEPALNLDDLMQTDAQGHGVVNILAADKLIQLAQALCHFLLWLLSELFERLPEVGDPEKPKLVFFFDEAHLLFSDLPKVIEDKVHQVVRLVRSKVWGVFFVTQSPIGRARWDPGPARQPGSARGASVYSERPEGSQSCGPDLSAPTRRSMWSK